MIDLSALSLSAAQRPAPGDKRDQADATADDGGPARQFGDFVKEADARRRAQSTNSDSRSKFANVAANDDLDVPIDAAGDELLAADQDTDAKSKLTAKADVPDLSPDANLLAADANDADPTAVEAAKQAKIRMSAAQIIHKTATNASSADAQGQAADAAAADAATDRKNMQILNKATATAMAGNPATTPAQELRALLELATSDGVADDDGVAAPGTSKTRRSATADDADAAGTDDSTSATVDKGSAPNQTAIQHAVAILGGEVGAGAHLKGAQVQAQQGDDDAKITLVTPDAKSLPTDAVKNESVAESGSEAAAGNKTDFVTVLEARRYLGFSTDSAASIGTNANALTDAIKGDANWAQVIQSVKNGSHATSTVVNTLKLQMSPEHLGNVTASLRLKGEELSVEVRVETADAYRQLTQDQDGIVKALKQHGFSIDQVSIQLSPAARADGGQMGGDPNQSGSNAQNMQDGSQGETARQREESARRNANQGIWTSDDGTQPFNDTGSGVNDSASGNLYL